MLSRYPELALASIYSQKNAPTVAFILITADSSCGANRCIPVGGSPSTRLLIIGITFPVKVLNRIKQVWYSLELLGFGSQKV